MRGEKMSMKDEVLELKKELEEVKEQSFASEILSDYKKANKRQFVIILVILGMFTALLSYTIYLLNDIGTIETTTQEVNNIDSIDGSVINGDNYGEDKAN